MPSASRALTTAFSLRHPPVAPTNRVGLEKRCPRFLWASRRAGGGFVLGESGPGRRPMCVRPTRVESGWLRRGVGGDDQAFISSMSATRPICYASAFATITALAAAHACGRQDAG